MTRYFRQMWRVLQWLSSIERNKDRIAVPFESDYQNGKVLSGTILARMNQSLEVRSLQDTEFQVFSQFGDDGIIQWIVDKAGITNKTFVEFGVERYTEANTRFLVAKDKWRGLVIDGDQRYVDIIRQDRLTMLFDVQATCAFITAENINELIAAAGFSGPLGILSVDIDGMDYWVWQAIDVVQPDLVIAEYNAIFGPDRPITLRYDPSFYRGSAHPTKTYYGASFAALDHLAAEKGYTFIGCNSNGNNAYFLRAELAAKEPFASLEREFVEAAYAEFARPDGTRVRGTERLAQLKGLPVVNVVTGEAEAL